MSSWFFKNVRARCIFSECPLYSMLEELGLCLQTSHLFNDSHHIFFFNYMVHGICKNWHWLVGCHPWNHWAFGSTPTRSGMMVWFTFARPWSPNAFLSEMCLIASSMHISSVYLDITGNRVGLLGMVWMEQFNTKRAGGAIRFVPQHHTMHQRIPRGFVHCNDIDRLDPDTIAGKQKHSSWVVHGM